MNGGVVPTSAGMHLDLPPAVELGPGSLAALPKLAGRHGRRVLVVSGGRWLERAGLRRRVDDLLAGFEISWVTLPRGEPTTATVEEARASARGARPELIIAVGGGSVLDTAKALSVMVGAPAPVHRYLEGIPDGLEVPGPGVPWIAVPTTAGTGAEATKNAVLKAEALGVKRSIRSPWLMAAAAVVDAELGLEVPAEVTGTCGLDALTQLVESYVSRKTNPFVQSLVRGAFLPMLDALEALAREPHDIGQRAAASYGAFVSGVALANAGLGAAHGYAAGLGGKFDLAHGLLCAVFMPQVLQANAEVIRGQIAELAGGRQRSRDPVEWLAGEITRLLTAYGLPTDLSAWRIPRASIPELAALSSGSSMKGNPRELTQAEKERILDIVLGGKR